MTTVVEICSVPEADFNILLLPNEPTVIYFQNLVLMTGLRLNFSYMTFKHTTGLLRILGKTKKAYYDHEGQTKARESMIPKFYMFS